MREMSGLREKIEARVEMCWGMDRERSRARPDWM
jgi:hypothetical protein